MRLREEWRRMIKIDEGVVSRIQRLRWTTASEFCINLLPVIRKPNLKNCFVIHFKYSLMQNIVRSNKSPFFLSIFSFFSIIFFQYFELFYFPRF